MATATDTAQLVPTGIWTVDPLHSNANFEVEHAGVSIFRGGFKPVDARLVSSDDGIVLEGAVSVDSISVDDDNIRPHLLSPEFFDVEQNPEVRFHSTEVTGTTDDLRIVGELSLAGTTRQLEARGKLRGPIDTGAGDKLAISLEVTIDRTDYGMNWQMELPSGGVALANEVKLLADLEFGRD